MGNWTALLPAVEQTGLGDFCEKQVTVPEGWAGKKGVIGVVQDAPDGVLYQVRRFTAIVLSPFRLALLDLLPSDIFLQR